MHSPKISVLFSTFNRAALLRDALSSLTRQTLSKANFEVVVVDDGSTDHTSDIVAGFESNLPIRHVYQIHSGLAEGRNSGLRLAQAPVVMFMDDDDVASPSLLDEHLRSHRLHPDLNVGVLGFGDVHRAIADIPFMHFLANIAGYRFSYSQLEDGDVLDYKYFWVGRSSCKRDLLCSRGFFDPLFKFGCEDIELGFRLKESGTFKIIYNAAARSTMNRAVSLDDFLRRSYLQGRSNYNFWKKHLCYEIETWADVRDLDARWATAAAEADLIIASARGLDAIANTRSVEGLELDELTTSMLHRRYAQAIKMERLRGSYERMVESRSVQQIGSNNSDMKNAHAVSVKKKAIAIVGNGPIRPETADQIDRFDTVIRFNRCGNYGLAGKKIDILVMVNTGESGYCLAHNPRWINREALSAASEIWFPFSKACAEIDRISAELRGDDGTVYVDHSDEILQAHGRGRPYRFFNERTIREAAALLDKNGGVSNARPSTGLLTLLDVKERYPDNAIVLFGFTHEGWEGHAWDAERAIAHSLATYG
jgi:glycosyltransferase involved in cell wall biosynthesis